MLTAILGLLPSVFTTVNGITNAIANAKIAALTATTQQEQIAAQERVATLQAQRDALIAETQKSSLPIYIQSIIGGSCAILLAKVLVWDKAFGEWTGGHTDSLGTDLWWVVTAVTGFYFLHAIIRGK